MTEAEEIAAAFKLVCKKCGSEDVVIDIEHSRHYDSCTIDGGITIGCNACKDNTVILEI